MASLISQAAAGGGALLSTTHHCSLKFVHPNPPLFSKRRPNFSLSRRRLKPLSLANPPDSSNNPTTTSSSTVPLDDQASASNNSISFVAQQNVPLEGVIQFEKPNSNSNLAKWGLVGVLAGGDVAALLLFAAIGRFSHGLSVFDLETLKTADPFIAGWFLCAYFLGGYGDEGRGKNGLWRAIVASTKSWSLGIPLGIIIRAVTIGHTPPANFILVTMGSTAVFLVGWRALLFTIVPTDKGKKNDVYKRGSPFELFELLTSLVRRW
ncbi:hypothetical protein CASFOL_038191 [Castilleja foliolosa]|uniref:Transmembrane protein n=1 Tax=Castilleja foliolosa TaxID=1961234 RepID=A0ABD3BKC8_9LAMI